MLQETGARMHITEHGLEQADMQIPECPLAGEQINGVWGRHEGVPHSRWKDEARTELIHSESSQKHS